MIKSLITKIFRRVANLLGYNLHEKGLGYFHPETIIEAAKKQNLSVCEYLESTNLSGVGKRRDLIISKLNEILPDSISQVLEIGAGTGMYLEKIIENQKPKNYEVYETAVGWRDFLKKSYSSKTNLLCHNANGKTLSFTKDAICDAVFSHGVFVYLPLIDTITYLEESVRVLKPGGLMIFDCFTDEYFNLETIKKWQKGEFNFPVVLSKNLLTHFFTKNNLQLITTFNINYHDSESSYFVVRKV